MDKEKARKRRPNLMKKQTTKCKNCKSYKIRIRENYPFGKKSNPVRTAECKRCGKKII